MGIQSVKPRVLVTARCACCGEAFQAMPYELKAKRVRCSGCRAYCAAGTKCEGGTK